MSIVSFDRIAKVNPANADPVNAAIGSALGPINNGGARTTLYDPLWGYFLFGQKLQFNYGDSDAYVDRAEFVITGTFNRSVEEAVNGAAYPSDTASFNAICAKYQALLNVFEAAAQASEPNNYIDWGTVADLRTIQLPEPLRDKDDGNVYGLPVEIRVEKTRFPEEIKYRAVLAEAKWPQQKLLVNGQVLDRGLVTIVPPAPIVAEHRIAGAAGAILQIRNYTAADLTIAGLMPRPYIVGTGVPADVKAFVNGMIDSLATIQLAKKDGSVVDVWTNLSVQEPSLNLNLEQHVAEINVKGKL